MSLSFDMHEPDCRPLAPCRNCKVAEFLRKKLSDEDLATLNILMKGDEPGKMPLTTPIRGALKLSVRAENGLLNGDIRFLDDLVRRTRNELLRLPNFGKISLKEVEDGLAEVGWCLEALPPKA